MSAASGPISFFDVETTGLSSEDRIVSLGVVHFADARELASARPAPQLAHLVFNPGCPSHPRARKVHGYADALLARQDAFTDHADGLHPLFSHGGQLVAHNASFDRRFVLAAFAEAKRRLKQPAFDCTMLAHRRIHGSPSGLDAVLTQMGAGARQGHHGALADAWLAMAVYCWLHGLPVPDMSRVPVDGPSNLKDGAAPAASFAATVSPVATVAPVPTPRRHSDAFTSALETLAPLATVMVRIASADGAVYQAEVEALSLLMHTTLSGMPHRLDDGEHQDLLAALVELPIDDEALARAARAIMRSRELRESVAGWVRVVTFADGSGSPAEHAQIVAVTEALGAARRAIG